MEYISPERFVRRPTTAKRGKGISKFHAHGSKRGLKSIVWKQQNRVFGSFRDGEDTSIYPQMANLTDLERFSAWGLSM